LAFLQAEKFLNMISSIALDGKLGFYGDESGMNPEIDRNIVKAIVEVAVFLEFSDDDSINPDDAIQALEQLAATLQMASEEVRSSLCSSFRDISGEYKGERAEFVESLGEGLGLTYEHGQSHR
jgi:hypothetical protein